MQRTFGEDVAFLREHVETLVLGSEPGGARLAVVPEWQGRAMTSSAAGEGGAGFGWLNRARIASGVPTPHMNVYGGEDRFWLGPEGGPFGLFFRPGAEFTLAEWQTPAPIDSEPWPVVARPNSGADEVVFAKRVEVTNRAGTRFAIDVRRTLRMVPRPRAAELLGCELGPERPGDLVAFESENRITNAGAEPWTRESGLVSVWTVGMFAPSAAATAVLPYVAGPESERGPVVNDAYFGRVPADRLAVADGAVLFRSDGKRRAKIGLGPRRARPVLGGWDAERGVLTLVRYGLEPDRDYVDSMWEEQREPYAGDAVNAYNDGPPAPGAPPLGPFWELETSSPAAALRPGESLTHVHSTFHLTGGAEALDRVARAVLGIGTRALEAGRGSRP